MIVFNGRIHVGFIVVLYLYVAIGNRQLDDLLNPIFLVIGALFPDADHRHAPAGRILPLWIFFKHRGFTHTLYGWVLFSGILAIFNHLWAISFAIGYASHLVLDCMTPSGINWLGKRKSPIKR